MDIRQRIGIDAGNKLPAEAAIAWARDNDVAYIDCRIDLPPNALESFDEARCAPIREACAAAGIHLGLHTLSAVNIAEVSPFLRDAADDYLRAYIDADIPVSLGTDAPVVPYDPWWVLHHFTTRGTISAGVTGPDQAVGREEALRAMTAGYAWLTFAEHERGTLAPGMLADLIVIAEPYLDCPDPCLETMEVDLTVLGGTVVWEH